FRTLPMVWYVPPLSPIQSAVTAGALPTTDGVLPDVDAMRIPVRYLANLLTAGAEAPIRLALKRLLAMRAYMRAREVEGQADARLLAEADLTEAQVAEMYQYLAIGNYEDRYVIPTSHREAEAGEFSNRGACGFSFGNGCSDGATGGNIYEAEGQRSTQFYDASRLQESLKRRRP
ncbi:MAG: nitrate reductase subunit beta, partial [Steroidobacteraceae bacterium]